MEKFKVSETLAQIKVEAQLFGQNNFSNFPKNTKVQIHENSGEVIATKYLDTDYWQKK